MKVWVTRDEDPGGPLSAALAAAGLQPVLAPVIKRIATSDAADSLARLTADDWLVLTSAFACRCLVPGPARIPQVAVVGPGTLAAARELGLRIELVSDAGGSAELFEQLRQRCSHGMVCYTRSSLAPPLEPWRDVTVTSPVVYDTCPRDFDRSVAARVDVAAITSPSAARMIGRIDVPVASIGPATSAALKEIGQPVWLESAEPTFAALATAIAVRQSELSRHHRA